MKSESEKSILIVDDEIPIQRSLKRSFFKLPYRIFTASGAEEAYGIIEKNEIDIILSDFKMPGADGNTFLLGVKERYPSTIRILISGYIDKAKLMESLFRFNVVSLFPKPWSNKNLLNRIKELLEIKSRISDINIWTRLNNPILFNFENKNLPIENLEEYIKYDIPIYTGLLHLYNSDYYNGNHQLDLKRIINHFSVDSVSQMITAIQNDNFLNKNIPIMRSSARKMDEIYPVIKNKLNITTKIGDNLSPSFFILMRYILFFIENKPESDIKDPTYFVEWNGDDLAFSKSITDRSIIIDSFTKLWNIATPLTIFSENLFKAALTNSLHELSEGERLLFILDYFIHKDVNSTNTSIMEEVESLYMR